MIGGLISAATLLTVAQIVSYESWRNKEAERLLEGVPEILVRHGHVNKEVMAKEQVTQSELIEALR